MTEWKARRFWKQADIRAAGPDEWQVLLDDKPLNTPGKVPLVLPTKALALELAQEWDAQGDVIDPTRMPLTRASNSAVEKVARQFGSVAGMLCAYGGTDLLSYRAEAPERLTVLQAEAWDPLLEWADDTFGARLRVTQGVIPVPQDEDAMRRLAMAVHSLDVFGLTALHDLVTLPGSLILGLAVIHGRTDAATAHGLSRVDEEFQISQWGEDAEARVAAENDKSAMTAAERLWTLTRTS